jgi:uncharacterized integral membrane protein
MVRAGCPPQQRGSTRARRTAMKNWKLWAAIALAVLIGIVVLQNTESVTTKILWITVEMPRVLLLLTTLLVGVVIGVLLGRRMRRT